MRIKLIHTIKRFLFAALLMAAITGLMFIGTTVNGQEQTGEGEMQSMEASGYAGQEECAACHEDYVEALKKTPHGMKMFVQRSSQGCETCHGPGKAHVESGGDPALIKNLSRIAADEASEICLQCHETGNRNLWKGSMHQQRELACLTCHSIHSFKSEKAQLKTARVEETCSTCHLQIKAQMQRTSHHPIREGLMTCADCHDPHGTTTPKLLKANSANEQCYTCHTEKRGPFLWEHPPVRENCLTCHTPHGSNHEKLLVQNRPWLCRSCHLDTRHPGSLYDQTNAVTSNREFARSCSNCHITTHGSNHPSGWTFLR